MEFPGKAPAVTVGVAHGDGGDHGGGFGDPGAAVADLPPRGQELQVGDTADPGQGGGQGQKRGVHLVAGVHAIGDDAGTDHLIGGGEIHEPRGVIQVADGDVDPPLF